MTSAPFSRLPGNRNFLYIVCTLEVSVKGDVQRLPEVRDALRNTSLERLTIKQQLRNPTLPTLIPSPSDSDITIIYNESPQPDSDDTHLPYDSDETVLPEDSDETELHYDSDETRVSFCACL